MLLDGDADSISMLYNLAAKTARPNKNGALVVKVEEKGNSVKIVSGKLPDAYGADAMTVAPMMEPFALNSGNKDPMLSVQPYDSRRQVLREALLRMLDEV